jgi:hypothetical protein
MLPPFVAKVWVEVEETAPRVKDIRNWKDSFKWDAEDAAVAKVRTLTGWDPHDEIEYRAVASRRSRTRRTWA